MTSDLTTKDNFFFASILLVLFALVALPFIGDVGLWNPLEPRYGAIAKNSFITGDWFLLRYIDNIYIEKPPHFFWLINFSYWLSGGVNIWASRIPSIFATLLSLIGIFLIGKRIFGNKIAFLATLIYLLNFRTIFQLRRIQVDAILVSIVIWGIYFLIRGIEKRDDYNKWFTFFYSALGVSILFKGLAAIIPLFLIMLCTLNYFKQFTLRELDILRGFTIILFIIAAFWIIPALLTGLKFSNLESLIGIGISRFLTVPAKHGPFYYVWVYLIEFLPWSLLFPFSLYYLLKEKRWVSDPRIFILVIWFIFILLFSMANSSKHAVYIMPLYPASALIVSWFIISALEKKDKLILPIFFKLLSAASLLIPIFLLSGILLIKYRLIWHTEFTIFSQFMNEFTIIPLILLLITFGTIQIFLCFKPIEYSAWKQVGVFILAVLSITLTYHGLIAPWLDKNKGGGELPLYLEELPKSRPLASYGELSLSESGEGFLAYHSDRSFKSVEIPRGEALEKLRNRRETIFLLLSRDLPLLEIDLKMPLYIAFAENIWKRTIVAASVFPIKKVHK